MNNKKIAVLWLCFVMIISFVVIVVELPHHVKAGTIWVDDDYVIEDPTHKKTIQAAVDNATPGDTVYVYNGTYYENVVLNLTLNLIGESNNNTTINASGSGDVVRITTNFVNVSGFTITNSGGSSGDAGIELNNVYDCRITNNIVSSNINYGIKLGSSFNNSITSNKIIRNNGEGLYLGNSSNNTLANNNITINDGYGITLRSSLNNIITNNTLLKNDYGFYLRASSNNNITYNEILSNDRIGIYVYSSSNNNNIYNNNISSNNASGIHLYGSSNNNITNNNFVNDGVSIYGNVLSHYNTHSIPDNNIVNNKPLYYYKNRSNFSINNIPVGQLILANCTDVEVSKLMINNTDVGVLLAYSTNISITSNNASNNRFGIYLFKSFNNNISYNILSMNGWYGIRVWYSINNTIYHNNILDNFNQADDTSNSGNMWDSGYPLGGNLWSDYNGEDSFKGPNQDIPGSDGIGDTSYIIDSNSQDNYPLMNPYKPLENYTILKQGWNLISIPLIQDEQNLTRVLGSIDGCYDAVQWYNITDINDPWKHNKVGKPFGNDLNKLNESIGFWIHITNSGDTIFVYNGTQPIIDQTIDLFPGWNLVGYPSLSNKNRTEALNNIEFGNDVDAIWTHNATTQKWKEITASDNFEVGRGYWIHSKVTKTWIVPL